MKCKKRNAGEWTEFISTAIHFSERGNDILVSMKSKKYLDHRNENLRKNTALCEE
jgi:hypothetical protein